MLLLVLLALWQALPIECLNHGPNSRWAMCSWNTRDGLLSLWQGNETCPVAGDWSPWSHHPVCLEPKDNKPDGSDPINCVFTLSTFRGNQGLSLITTPDLAASLVGSLDDSMVSPGLRNHLSGPGQAQQDGRVSYKIQNLPGRGKGLVARRRISRHETIMVGFPVLLVRMDFINDDHYTQRQKHQMVKAGVSQLPTVQKQAVMALARSTGGEPILDAIRTNGFGVEVDGVQHLALFTDGSVSKTLFLIPGNIGTYVLTAMVTT